MSEAAATAGHSIELRYRFDATVEQLFDAWTDPDILGEWWGPEGVRSKVVAFDLRPGGTVVFEMTFDDGTISHMSASYREIDRPRRLVLIITENCNTGLPPGVEPQVAPTPVTLDFVDHGDSAEIILRQDGLQPDYAKLVSWGWGGGMTKLKKALQRRGS